MMDFTRPVTAAFDLQRTSLEQGQQTLAETVDVHQRVADAAIDGLDAQQSAQRSAVERNQELVYGILDAVESNVPNAEPSIENFRETLDEQYATLLEHQETLYDDATIELEHGIETSEELTGEYLTVLAEQLVFLEEMHDELEAQSIEAADELQAQFEALQAQFEAIQRQVENSSEEAVETVETVSL